MLIPLDRIRPPKFELRPVLKQTVDYHELMDSVRNIGILQPILVRPKGELYEVIEGNWRYNVAKDLGMKDMPCLVRDMTDDEVEVVQLQAQANRPETSTSDLAKRIQLLLKREDMTIGQLGRLINKGPSWIKRILCVNRLVPKAVKMVDRGEMTVRNAATLSRLPAVLQPNFLVHAVVDTAVDFEELVRRAVKDYRQCSQQSTTSWIEYRDTHYVASLRQLKEIEAEAKSGRAARQALPKLDAKTPLDGWRACLAWIYRIDPDSLTRQKEEKRKKKNLTFEARRTRNETTMKHVRNLSPEIKL